MTVLASLPRVVVPAGTRVFGPANIPQGTSSIRVSVTRFSWPGSGASVLNVTFEVSLDGGSTWPGKVAADIGAASAYKGDANPPAVIEWNIPGNPQSTQRRVRATTVAAQSLDMALTVEGF